jgi:hypothetical protein
MADKLYDTDALIAQLSRATASQGEAVRKATHAATLKALQGRELTLKAIRDTVKAVTQAASAGAAQNPLGDGIDELLAKAVAGMDAAVRQAVEANHRALRQLIDQGVDLRDKQLKKALADIEKMEDTMFEAIGKAVGGAGGQSLAAPWAQALRMFRQDGSATGSASVAAVEQLTAQAQTALREGRAASQRAAQALLDHYAALASGVLIGMSEALPAAPRGPAAANAAPGPAAPGPAASRAATPRTAAPGTAASGSAAPARARKR